MPWRKAWIDPDEYDGRQEELGIVLGKRAYEVWVSEVSESISLFVKSSKSDFDYQNA